MKRTNTGLLMVLLVISLVAFLTVIAGAIFYTSFKGEKARRDLISSDITDKRISELENELRKLKDNKPSLTPEQISAVVELWCPDDNYNKTGFLSVGSGTIISEKGIIFTNRHVVSNEDWSIIKSSPTCYVGITDDISQPSKFKYLADIVAFAPQTDDFFDFDVAVLRIYDVCHDCPEAPSSLPEKFPYLEIGSSVSLVPGNYVAIVGYPEIGAGTWNFTDGIISGRVGDFVLKTDAKIDSGNSGGAAINAENELIGIPTWIISGQAESIGYVIEIDDVYKWFQEKVLSKIK